ncbi:VCBS repeat-containing protein [Salmonella enterica subsp. enterica serovar Daytona]|uniref:VCBS repeat-containing protein n=1 Tax=Salmonella enterica subsp. enterica serovar Daytona TaxID=1962639 RepID=A0A447JE00_SALET|nr:VCBS repeat-containing protein [Salmonella enterica subsp. enterica serovar Daytona]
MRLLAVVSKLTGVSTTVESSAVTLNAPSIVKLSVAREEISQLTRINQDLVVTLHSGETITIKNFYVTNDLGASQLVLAENDGTLWWVENPQAGLHFEQIADINELLVTSGASHEAGGAVWPWVLAGAVAAGALPLSRLPAAAIPTIIRMAIIRPPITPILTVIPLITAIPAAVPPTAILQVAVIL